MALREMEYKDFSFGLNMTGFRERRPTVGQFELTFKCPLECDFCYCSVYTSPEHTRREVTTLEAQRILTGAAEAGCLWMCFSGGDPFIRRDFRQIYDHAIGLGLICTIFCSGLIVTDDWIEHLKKNPPLRLELPLYGVTKETYETVSGRKNTFERALANIRKLVDSGLPLRIKSKLTKDNRHEAEALKAFVEDELGLSFDPSWDLFPRLDGSRDHLAKRLSPLEVRVLEEQYGVLMGCDSGTMALVSDEANPKVFRCAAGVHSFYINPYGELNFCSYIRGPKYDLKTGSLAEGMQALYAPLRELAHSDGSCGTCTIHSTCDSCPGQAVLETGRLDGKSEELCQLNHELRGRAAPQAHDNANRGRP